MIFYLPAAMATVFLLLRIDRLQAPWIALLLFCFSCCMATLVSNFPPHKHLKSTQKMLIRHLGRLATGSFLIPYSANNNLLFALLYTITLGELFFLHSTLILFRTITFTVFANAKGIRKFITLLITTYSIGIGFLIGAGIIWGIGVVTDSEDFAGGLVFMIKVGYFILLAFLAGVGAFLAWYEYLCSAKYRCASRPTRLWANAIALGLPFQIVRVTYTMSVLFEPHPWLMIFGSFWCFVIALITEYVVVLLYIGMGLTVKSIGETAKIEKEETAKGEAVQTA